MERRQFVALFCVCLLVGDEGKRVEILSRPEGTALHADPNSSAEFEAHSSPDLDLQICGAGGTPFRCNKLGCHRHYMWLDTQIESCRLTDEYKLNNNPVYFAKVEVQHLLEESKKLNDTGCVVGTLFGGEDEHMFKCMRRLQHMVRLLMYINKVKTEASSNPRHPAHEYVSSDLFKGLMKTLSENIAGGFDKYERISGGTGPKYSESWRELQKIKVLADERKHDNYFLNAFEKEKASQDAACITSAMLKMFGIELTDEQKAVILSAAQQQQVSTAELVGEAVQMLEEDISNTMLGGAIDESALGNLSLDVVTNLKEERPLDPSAFVQTSSTISTPAQVVGPLKSFVDHSLVWVVARIAWLMIFLMGSIVNIIGVAVIFPLLILSCLSVKFVKLLGIDLLYKYGYLGDATPAMRGFRNIGGCPAALWEFVGFDFAFDVFMEPARIASDTTGVVNLVRTRSKLCEHVQCGENALCRGGRCRCCPGYYPNPGRDSCTLISTHHGCACKANWQHGESTLFKSSYLGCPATLRFCEVDTRHPSWGICKRSLHIKNGYIPNYTYDNCTFARLHATVLPVTFRRS